MKKIKNAIIMMLVMMLSVVFNVKAKEKEPILEIASVAGGQVYQIYDRNETLENDIFSFKDRVLYLKGYVDEEHPETSNLYIGFNDKEFDYVINVTGDNYIGILYNIKDSYDIKNPESSKEDYIPFKVEGTGSLILREYPVWIKENNEVQLAYFTKVDKSNSKNNRLIVTKEINNQNGKIRYNTSFITLNTFLNLEVQNFKTIKTTESNLYRWFTPEETIEFEEEDFAFDNWKEAMQDLIANGELTATPLIGTNGSMKDMSYADKYINTEEMYAYIEDGDLHLESLKDYSKKIADENNNVVLKSDKKIYYKKDKLTAKTVDDSDLKKKIESETKKTLLSLYDITLTKSDESYEFEKSDFTIQIKLGDLLKQYKDLEAIYVDKDNNITKMSITTDKEYANITTDHLSIYGIVGTLKEKSYTLKDDKDKISIKFTSTDDKYSKYKASIVDILDKVKADVKKNIEIETKKSLIAVYDITITDENGNKVDTEETDYLVTISLDKELKKYKDYTVFYLDNDNKIKTLETSSNDDTISFKTTHFSKYGIVGTLKETEKADKNAKTGDKFITYLTFGGVLIVFGVFATSKLRKLK